MSVGIVLVTHQGVATSLAGVVTRLFDVSHLPIETFEVEFDADTGKSEQALGNLCADTDSGDGVLMLTDLYGATPSNIACAVLAKRTAVAISGLNLAMLVRAFNYMDLSLDDLCGKLAAAGAESVVVNRSGIQGK